MQSHQSLHSSRTCSKWAYILHIISVNAQTSLIVCEVLPEPSLLSHMHIMGVHMTYFSVNAQTRLSMQSIHCARTYTKWVCLRHILSVNFQTSLSMRAVSPEPSLLSHMRKMGLHTAYSFSQCSDKPYYVCSFARAFTALAHAQNGPTYDIFFSQCSDETEYACSLARAFTALAHTQNGCVYGIFYQSMLKQALACVQSRQSLHCSRTCTKWAYIWYILAFNAQTRMRMCAVSLEPSLLSHMHKMGVHTAHSFSQCSDAPEHARSLVRAFAARTLTK